MLLSRLCRRSVNICRSNKRSTWALVCEAVGGSDEGAGSAPKFSLKLPLLDSSKTSKSGLTMASDYELDDEQSPLHAHSQDSSLEEESEFGTAVELETQVGLKSPPAKRIRRHSSSGLPAPSSEFELEEGEEEVDGESEDSEEGSDEESVDSFILDIFHAKGTEAAENGTSSFKSTC
jgi:hypothetical protein